MDIALRMSFLPLNNIEVNFINLELNLRLYTIDKVFFITRQIEIINKKSLQL